MAESSVCLSMLGPIQERPFNLDVGSDKFELEYYTMASAVKERVEAGRREELLTKAKWENKSLKPSISTIADNFRDTADNGTACIDC